MDAGSPKGRSVPPEIVFGQAFLKKLVGLLRATPLMTACQGKHLSPQRYILSVSSEIMV